MKNILNIVVALILTSHLTSPEKKIKTLKVAVLQQYPFVIIKDDKTFDGLLVHKMTAVAEKAGYKIDYILFPSAQRLLSSVYEGHVDASLGGLVHDKSHLKYDYVKTPFFKHNIVAITDNRVYPEGIVSLDQLTNGKIGYTRGYVLGQEINQFVHDLSPRSKLELLDPSTALRLMSKKRISSFLIDLETPHQSEIEPYSCYGLDFKVTQVDYVMTYITLHKSDASKAIIPKLEQALKDIDKNGTADQLITDFWTSHEDKVCQGYKNPSETTMAAAAKDRN